jgi:hypothetical protein
VLPGPPVAPPTHPNIDRGPGPIPTMEAAGEDDDQAPRRRPIAVCCLAILLLLAGCGGASTAADRTPYDVPTRIPLDDDDADLPPGVNKTAVGDPLSVADTHARTLEGRSYRLLRNRSVRTADGAVVSLRNVSFAVARYRDNFAVVTDRYRGDRVVHEEYYTFQGDVVVAEGNGDRRAFSVLQDGRGPTTVDEVLRGDPPFRDAVYRYLRAAGTVEVTKAAGSAVGDGDATFRIAARSFDEPELLHPRIDGTLETASLTVRMSDRGLVTGVRLRATVEGENRTVELNDRILIRDVDQTLVWAPEWFDTARDSLNLDAD